MEIYNRRKFAFGVVFLFLGLSSLILGFLKGFDVKQVIQTILALLIGASEIYRSVNREAAKHENIEAKDERNHLIKLTSKSRAFDLTQVIIIVLMFLFLIMGKQSGEQVFVAIGVTFAFAYSVSMLSEIFSGIYYERHM
ncbi:hypothetical protein [Desulfosporosinus youngiae]|uniref:DUF2178 domain-containing protein n=1 Tax=Desulfosporosinus youngiae DSM 17734 TaxID=768710 RepID=H5XVB3_9FIRM|nr:hypothetical protein [Desulfosporosinus youngiae]EHQ89849.1 hypothetical protein DesyoDRAFT_2800 [Desulfosporosinus youngiae DSM 17734]